MLNHPTIGSILKTRWIEGDCLQSWRSRSRGPISLDRVILVVCWYTVTYWSARGAANRADECRDAIGGACDLVVHVSSVTQNLAQGGVCADRGRGRARILQDLDAQTESRSVHDTREIQICSLTQFRAQVVRRTDNEPTTRHTKHSTVQLHASRRLVSD